MPKNHETANDMAARCVEMSNQLRAFLFSGQEMAWDVRRDAATAANLLVTLGTELEEGQQNRGVSGD